MANLMSLGCIIAEAKTFIQTKNSKNKTVSTKSHRILSDSIAYKPKYESKQLPARPMPELPACLLSPTTIQQAPNKLQY